MFLVFLFISSMCVKFIIWVARNDFCFRDKQPSAVSVIEGVKSLVRFHLPVFSSLPVCSPSSLLYQAVGCLRCFLLSG